MITFSTRELRAVLQRLAIAFESNAIELDGLRFKSLRKIEPAGIYFLEAAGAGTRLPPRSLILCTAFDGLDAASNSLIRVAHPQLAFYKLMRHFHADAATEGAIHPTAIVDPQARIGARVRIGPYCVIGKSTLAEGVTLSSHVVVTDACTIGANTLIESHSTIGASGVAWIWDPDNHERVVQPQIGGVVIGRDCFLGSDISVVRGSVNEDTTIGDATTVAHGTKLGHGCAIGSHNHFANNVSLAGNVTTGERCFFGSASVVRPMVSLCADTTVGAGAVVVGSVSEPGLVLMGVPAKSVRPDKDKLSGVPKGLQGA